MFCSPGPSGTVKWSIIKSHNQSSVSRGEGMMADSTRLATTIGIESTSAGLSIAALEAEAVQSIEQIPATLADRMM